MGTVKGRIHRYPLVAWIAMDAQTSIALTGVALCGAIGGAVYSNSVVGAAVIWIGALFLLVLCALRVIRLDRAKREAENPGSQLLRAKESQRRRAAIRSAQELDAAKKDEIPQPDFYAGRGFVEEVLGEDPRSPGQPSERS